MHLAVPLSYGRNEAKMPICSQIVNHESSLKCPPMCVFVRTAFHESLIVTPLKESAYHKYRYFRGFRCSDENQLESAFPFATYATDAGISDLLLQWMMGTPGQRDNATALRGNA